MADSVDDEEVKLLLIEDDEAAAEMYRMRLELDGYTVVVAGDGESGLDAARQIRNRPWRPVEKRRARDTRRGRAPGKRVALAAIRQRGAVRAAAAHTVR